VAQSKWPLTPPFLAQLLAQNVPNAQTVPEGFDDHHRAQPDRPDQLDILWQDVVRTPSFSLREPINDLQIANPSNGPAQTNQQQNKAACSYACAYRK